jgi:hypothetical protein
VVVLVFTYKEIGTTLSLTESTTPAIEKPSKSDFLSADPQCPNTRHTLCCATGIKVRPSSVKTQQELDFRIIFCVLFVYNQMPENKRRTAFFCLDVIITFNYRGQYAFDGATHRQSGGAF